MALNAATSLEMACAIALTNPVMVMKIALPSSEVGVGGALGKSHNPILLMKLTISYGMKMVSKLTLLHSPKALTAGTNSMMMKMTKTLLIEVGTMLALLNLA